MQNWILLAQAEVPDSARFIDTVARTPISKIFWFALILTIIRVIVFGPLRNTPVHKRTALFPLAKFANEGADALLYAAVVVFMLVRPFAIQTFTIPSGSMIDTLHVGDYIVANKFVYRTSEPKRGDIIVFKPPAGAKSEDLGNDDLIKRLIGIPGDVIEIRDEKLYRNGHAVDEAYWTYTDPNPTTRHEVVVPKESWDSIPRYARAENFKLVNYKGRVMPLIYSHAGANDPESMVPKESQFALTPEEQPIAMNLPPAAVPPGMYFFMGDNRNGSNDSRYWGFTPRENIIGKAWFVWLPLARWRMVDSPPPESIK